MSINNLTPDEHKIMVDAIHDSATVVHKGRMMNERIRELLESSIIESSQWTGSKPAITITYDTLDQFAELIVRECAKIADIADENKCEWIGGNILTHFGVKE